MHWPQTGNGNDRPTWSFVYYCFIIYHSMTINLSRGVLRARIITNFKSDLGKFRHFLIHLKVNESKNISRTNFWAKIYSPCWFLLSKTHQWGHASLSFSRFIIFFFSFFSGCASFYATFSTRILHLLFVIFGTLSSADLVPRWVLDKMWNLSFLCLSPQGFMKTSLLRLAQD